MALNNKSEIYEMELHETRSFGRSRGVMRVPGGWIYETGNNATGLVTSAVFVPFHNEFQPKPPSDLAF